MSFGVVAKIENTMLLQQLTLKLEDVLFQVSYQVKVPALFMHVATIAVRTYGTPTSTVQRTCDWSSQFVSGLIVLV